MGFWVFTPFNLTTATDILSKKSNCELFVSQVDYEVKSFCKRNKDELSNDMISLMQSSEKYVCGLKDVRAENFLSCRVFQPCHAGSKIKINSWQIK